MTDKNKKSEGITGSGDKKAADNQISSTMPTISIPKGGGAIRGIGEKFGVNPVTGTGFLSVPIFTSPGRSGFGPQLSLSYDSGSGNGPFGVGWNLSLPSITRKTDKGLPRYQDEDESDTFILSGAEDLVPVLVFRNGEWERDSFDSGDKTFNIQRYRPRIEGLFARIERWTNKDTGEVHWRSISKDNITTLYGKTADSRIEKPTDDPANKLHIFSWLICESYDDKGNAIFYTYEKENSDNIDTSHVYEKNRNPLIRSANRYLKRISYGNRTPREIHEDLSQRKDWLFEVVLDYDEGHYEMLPVDSQKRQFIRASKDKTQKWPVRQDPFSSYRAGFEVRTYRLCRRVLMFHQFPDELGIDNYLVRSTEFIYDESPIASFITAVVQSGYVHRDNSIYLKKSLPPLDFEYSKLPDIEKAAEIEIKIIDEESLENLPYGLDGTNYQWADLDGEGISGILAEQADAWFYKPNLGGGRFGCIQVVDPKPSLAGLGGWQQQLMDLAGDGQLDLVEMSRPLSGFFERTLDGSWVTFTPFRSSPNVAWDDPNLKFVDLTGDGHADVIIAEDQAFIYYPSLAEEGFGPSALVSKPHDEESGPRLIFADGTQSIYLADMSGDGLTDLVRILNGEVCYWPNQGYGHFGAKVTMDNAPWFDYPDQFNQQRIRLADTDGSGVTDIIYLGGDGIYIYFNQSGNSWSRPHKLPYLPHIDNLTSMTVVDLLGQGTACLVWSSPLPGDFGRRMKYIDLMAGRKPHLLVSVKNNMGAETNVHYTSSTKFYLEDRAAGQPWITRLPFPVHVVKKVEVYDRLSRNRFVTRYSYHHGYFDGIEREFRGFGRVDQLDTEEFAALRASDAFPVGNNIDQASHIPPVLTKTWFHTGAYLQGQSISHQSAHEYYGAPEKDAPDYETKIKEFDETLLEDTLQPDTILLKDGGRLDRNPSAEEERQACRVLKGSILRQEIYALDGDKSASDGSSKSEHPYSVSERNFTIEMLQHKGVNKYAVFFPHPKETIDYHYERNPDDPRISHTLTLDVDAFGNVLQSAAVGYGRLISDMGLSEEDRKKQTRVLITSTENRFTEGVDEDDAYRTPLPCEAITFELTFSPGDLKQAVNGRFDFSTLKGKVKSASLISYEERPSGGLQKRPIEHILTLYLKDDLSGPLPLKELEPIALPFETYKMALTPGLITRVYGNRINDAMLREGGYVQIEGSSGWWIPSGRISYSPDECHSPAQELAFARAHFFLPHRLRDPFGQVSRIKYDEPYSLLVLESQDALKNKVTSGERDAWGNIINRNDYRVLQPALITDPNGNRSEVAFDALGMVVGTAVMGKQGEKRGDTLGGFESDLDEDTLIAHMENPLDNPSLILKGATTRILYDLHRYNRTMAGENLSPNAVYTIVREKHHFDLEETETKIQHSFLYSDGFGRELQKKIQAEPGPIKEGGSDVNPRWVGSGWTIYNNKGKPVKKYEPFFDDTHDYRFAKIKGVSSTLLYDPVERVVATLHPNHTYEKVVFDPWRQETWDVNDNVLFADPREDTAAGGFFQRLKENDFIPTWYEERKNGQLGTAERSSAEKASAHASTPSVAYMDSLGRVFLTVSDNGSGKKYSTRIEIDIEGNQRAVLDAKMRTVMRYDYDMLSSQVKQEGMDAGTRWILNDVMGNPIYRWDGKGHRIRQIYDQLRRPTHLYVKTADKEVLAERIIYGEYHIDSQGGSSHAGALNLRGRVFAQLDGAGAVISSYKDPQTGMEEGYDFKGNLLWMVRRFAIEYKQALDWYDLEDRLLDKLSANSLKLEDLDAALAGLTEATGFKTGTTYDALNRISSRIMPDGSTIRQIYNEANLLDRVEANLEGDAAITPFVKNINYNERGQRVFIEYGNDVITEYEYDDKTFRLMRLRTFRNSKRLQDLSYFYDPAGNVTSIADDAQDIICFNQAVVRPRSDYTYDAMYRLIEATGREQIGQAEQHTTWNDGSRQRLCTEHPNNWKALRRYTETYEYDEVGNFVEFKHSTPEGAGWGRTYQYNEESQIEPGIKNNRLSRTIVNDVIFENYAYDAHGSVESMPRYPDETFSLVWDFGDHLQSVNLGSGGTAYYVYNSEGHRVRKVIELTDGRRMKERLYIGDFEVFKKYNGSSGAPKLQEETINVTDDEQRIAVVEIRTTPEEDDSLRRLLRYQIGNHLGSAILEIDDSPQANIISYEEYYPHGSTSYQAVRSQTEAPRRYRYTGKERDEETGLYYYGARYYASWLGRWICVDPAGLIDGVNLYAYANNNSIGFSDDDGRQSTSRTNRPEEVVFIEAEGRTEASSGLKPTIDRQKKHLEAIENEGSGRYAGIKSGTKASSEVTLTSCQRPPLQSIQSIATSGKIPKGVNLDRSLRKRIGDLDARITRLKQRLEKTKSKSKQKKIQEEIDLYSLMKKRHGALVGKLHNYSGKQVIQKLFDANRGSIQETMRFVGRTPQMARYLFPGFQMEMKVLEDATDYLTKEMRDKYKNDTGFFIGVAGQNYQHAFSGSWGYKLRSSDKPGVIAEVHWTESETSPNVHEFRTFDSFLETWTNMQIWTFKKR